MPTRVIKHMPVTGVADMAAKFWDAGLVEYVGGVDAGEFLTRMLTEAAKTLLWTASYDSESGEGPHFPLESYAPDYESVIPQSDLEELRDDVEGFVRYAWPYLSINAGRTSPLPETAGHDLIMTRNGEGCGFWDGDWRFGDSLTELSKPFGTVGVAFTLDQDDESDTYGEVTGLYVHH